MADLDPDSLNKLKVVDLREHLSSRGLSTTGLKAELVKRLRTAILGKEQIAESSSENDSQLSNDESRLRAEEEARIRAEEEEARQRAEEEEARQRAEEEEARQRAEAEEARLKAEEEEARLRAEEEARLRAEEEARLRAEEEARLRAEEEARLRAEEEEARLRAIKEDARLKAEEEDRLRAEEEARLKAEEEARLRAEEETRLRAEEEARLRAKEEARLRAEEEARLRAVEEARLKAEEEARLRAEEEARLRAEEEARLRAEEEARLRAEKEAKLRAEEEARLRAEEEARLIAEKEQARLKAEEEQSRLRAEEKARLIAEAEQTKLKAEAEEKLRIQREEARKKAEEKNIEELRIREEQRKADEEEMRKEQERWLVEEQMRKAQEDHKKRMKAEEEKRRLEIERQKKIAEEEQKRKAEEQQLLAKEEERKKEQDLQMKYLKNNEPLQNEPLSSQNNTTANIPTTLQMPPVPPFASMPSMNIMPPPPTVLMSNIPQLLPPGTSLPPNSHPLMMSNISAPPTIIPPPPPPLNIMKPSVTPINQLQNNVEEIVNDIPQNSQFEIEIINDIESMDTNENPTEIKLPQALEKVLALKSERAQLLGVDPDSVVQPLSVSEEKIPASKSSVVTLVSVDEDEYAEEDASAKKRKESKSRRRKKKKKKRSTKNEENRGFTKYSEKSSHRDSGIDVDIEYVQEVIDISDPLYSQFMKVFEKFKLTENEKENEEVTSDSMKNVAKEEMFNPMSLRKKPVDLDDDDDDDKDDDKLEEEKPKLSKRKLKKLSRMTVAELKQKVNRPELVEMHDVTAKDPVLLLHLKASRNTVPVPRHWCFKRKYLQGKRGIEKPAFELPDFIKRTGIMEMRQALQEKEDQKTMKAKMRERVRPKLGKIDIDYQKLHDAFFKWQTKPKMTIHGDLYYEGKEFETRLKEKKPGDLSEDLRTALGMPTGPNANKCPPPWLIAMQRYGPPPSYPNLKIPGLNAPIPDSCSFGYHAGGWGKPPVDETGRPLYGDVFGTQVSDNQPHIPEEEIDHTLWGELESESSEEEEEDEEEEEEEEEEKTEDETGLVTPAEGLITPSGFSSIPAGMETPDMIELRKRKIEAEMEGGETPALYTILPEKKTERVGAAMMGSTHIYDMAAAIPGSKLRAPGTASVPPQGIEVALDPSELEMDTAAMAARYEQTMREQQSQLEKEDLSDMVAEHAARQKNKRKKQQLDSAKPPKKYKEFKF